MDKYVIIDAESSVKPQSVFKDIEFVDYNYDIKTKTNEEGDTIYCYKTLRCHGTPEENELIRFMIHTQYSLDDEIACINDKDEQYQNDRIALKNKAILIYEAIK